MHLHLLAQHSSTPTWWIGGLLALFAALSGALGDNLVRWAYAHAAARAAASSSKEKECCAAFAGASWPVWVLGTFCTTVLNSAGVIFAFSFAQASMIIPFAALHIFFGVIFAQLINGERFTPTRALACAFIVVGVAVVLLFAGKFSPHYSVDELIDNYAEPPMVLSTALIVVAIAVLGGGYYTTERAKGDVKRARDRRICISCLCGALGGLSNVLAKTTVEIFKSWSRSEPVWTMWGTYLVVSLTALTLVLQLVALNQALREFEATVVISTVNATLSITGTAEGAIYFKEYVNWGWGTWIFLPAGVVLSVIGIFLVVGLIRPRHLVCNLCGAGEEEEEVEVEARDAARARARARARGGGGGGRTDAWLCGTASAAGTGREYFYGEEAGGGGEDEGDGVGGDGEETSAAGARKPLLHGD